MKANHPIIRCFIQPLAAILVIVSSAGEMKILAQMVNNASDNGPGTLRDAINHASDGSVIVFDPSLSGATITLSNTLTITTNLTIDASALPAGMQINGNGTVQIFNVTASNAVVLNSITLTNGFVSKANGAGIYNAGLLTMNNCSLIKNVARDGFGGGIYNAGTLTLNQCTLVTNTGFGGGGGGILNNGILTVNQSTLWENAAGSSGGGIYNYGTLTVFNSIIAGNTGFIGGDIANQNEIIFEGSNIVQSLGNFTTGTKTGPTPSSLSPVLAPFANYGGPTPTVPPLPGSPAIDMGDDNATNLFATDQRGYPRLIGSHVDIGAVELQSDFSAVVTVDGDAGAGTLRYAIEYATNGTIITFDTNLSGATITLTSKLIINTNLTIDASSLSGGIEINGNGSNQIINIPSNITLALRSLTLTNGKNSGIYNAGTLTAYRCTLSGNHAGAAGGGIFNAGVSTLNECTLSGNSVDATGFAPAGGGIYNSDILALNGCTLSGNSSPAGFSGGVENDGTMTLVDTIVAGNSALLAADIGGSFTCGDVNIVENYYGTVTGPLPINAPPMLSSLGNYGGPTETMPPLPTSPAIDAGSDTATNISAIDQRGFPRLSGLHVDIGAVEFQVIIATNPAVVTGPIQFDSGTFGFAFTNMPGASFTAFASTNLALPFAQWSKVGTAIETPAGSGQYQFADQQVTNNTQRFYRVRSP